MNGILLRAFAFVLTLVIAASMITGTAQASETCVHYSAFYWCTGKVVCAPFSDQSDCAVHVHWDWHSLFCGFFCR